MEENNTLIKDAFSPRATNIAVNRLHLFEKIIYRHSTRDKAVFFYLLKSKICILHFKVKQKSESVIFTNCQNL